MEFSSTVIIAIIFFAFLFEYIDSALGMGYGTILTPILMLLGFNPLQIVPAVLLSELITGLSAAFFHHRKGNVYLLPNALNISKISRKIKSSGLIEAFRAGMPKHLRIGLLLALCSVAGAVFAVLIAVRIPKMWLKLYIGILVFSMGIIIFVTRNKQYPFSWKKLFALGLIASFNKGISGGGYGPIITGGQILSGVESRSVVGITSLAEGLTCSVGVLSYLLIAKGHIDWSLAPWLIIGAVLSLPFAATTVKSITEKNLKLAIALLTIVLGMITLANLLKG